MRTPDQSHVNEQPGAGDLAMILFKADPEYYIFIVPLGNAHMREEYLNTLTSFAEHPELNFTEQDASELRADFIERFGSQKVTDTDTLDLQQ